MEEQLLQPVTYGSVIYLSTESNLNSFMFSDGFMDQNVKLKSFESVSGVDYYDFSFCLFMVLPFSNKFSFEHQARVIQNWRQKLMGLEVDQTEIKQEDNLKDGLQLVDSKADGIIQNKVALQINLTDQEQYKELETNKQSKLQKLEYRREQIQELWNKLESEFQFNLGILQKSQNTSICFASSNFMLLHINSLKFLTLYQDDNNNLFLQLTENPDDECCFFNFDPSLKLQRGRSDNFVYEDEIVYIACAQKYSGKSPYLSIIQDDTIIGLIDSKENWKVNIYEQPYQESSSMRVGSCVWILSSELPLFLTCQRNYDPYYELYKAKVEGKPLGDKKSYIAQQLVDGKEIKQFFIKKPNDLLLDQLQILLMQIKEPKIGQSDELSPFGLWKIESLNVKQGGELKWDQTYRLKHVITGCYLAVLGDAQNARLQPIQKQELENQSKQKNIDFSITEFRFVPIDNLIQYKGATKSIYKISKDAFFMIQHVHSGLWISLDQVDGVQTPHLLTYIKDINTYRFREASLQTIWETYQINASQKLLIQFAQSPNTDAERQLYDNNYLKIRQMIIFLKDFLTNSQVANMSLEHEPQQVCRARQDRFKEQYTLGLLCWLLIEIFPTFEDFDTFQINPDEQGQKWTLKRKKGFKHSKLATSNFKQEQDLIMKRYEICKVGYELLAISATRNVDNQEFILQFINQLSEHIGFGGFVTESLKFIFQENKEILEEIHRCKINQLDQNQYQDIFQVMAHRLKLFEPYYKVEILQLLSAFTSQGNSSIYINQEKIFQSIVENKNFLFGHLMRIDYFDKSIKVEYRVFVDKEYESRQESIEDFLNKNDEQRISDYFIEQMRLYAQLSQNRNYACVKNLQELLPRQGLLDYMDDQKIPDRMKAILCQLILNLYIDQEPRSFINKPSFVRVLSQSFERQSDDITKRFIEINLTNDIKGTLRIRTWLLRYLQKKQEQLEDSSSNVDQTNNIYNELTYEVIKAISYMIKFGLFSSHANELFQRTEFSEGNCLNQLICYLANFLEFDHNYFMELKNNSIGRSYQVKKDDDFKLSINLNIFQKAKTEEEDEDQGVVQKEQDFAQSYPYLKRYTSLFKLIKYFTTKTCKYQQQSKYFILIKKEICSIFQALLGWREDYYIEKATNEFRKEGKSIKEIVNSIMPKISIDPGKYKPEKKHHQDNIDEEIQDFDEILGRPFVEVLIIAFYFAQDPDLQNSVVNLLYKRYTQREKLVQNLKKVSLVTADNDSYKSLSTLVNDIKNQISYSQSWLQIIESNIYEEKAEETLHITVNKFDQILREFEKKCDAESFVIKQKIFKHLGGHKLILKFLESGIRVIHSKIKYFFITQEEKEIHQKNSIILSNTTGMNPIRQLPPLQLQAMQTTAEIPLEDLDQFSYKKQFIQYVIRVFTTSHKILSKFAEGNISNQNSIFKIYSTLLDKPVRINIGQVEFLQQLYLRNVDLCLKPQIHIFKYVLDLIRDHGRHPEFLEIILVFLNASQNTDSIKIQIAIMETILNNYQYFDQNTHIKPKSYLPIFYEEKEHTIEYQFKQNFIQLVCQCIDSEISVKYIVKLHENLSVKQLIQMMNMDAKLTKGKLSLKQQIYTILTIYFEKIDKALYDFQACCYDFSELLKTVADKLNQPIISTEDQTFIAIQIVGLVNIYFSNFLKDIGMISLKMLSRDESIQKEQFIFAFAQNLGDQLQKFNKLTEYNQSLKELSNNFNLEIPQEFLVDFGDQHQKKFQKAGLVLKFLQATGENVESKNNQFSNWTKFKDDLLKSHEIKQAVLQERMRFKEVILNVQEIFEIPKDNMDMRLRDLIISRDDLIIKLLQYIEHWKVRNANKNTVIFIIKSIRALLKSENEAALTKMQIHLDSLRATQIALRLYWKDKLTEDIYIYQLIKWIIAMLQGGNKAIQTSILNLMRDSSDSEAFFQKIYNILTEYMATMKKADKQLQDPKSIQKRKFIAKTLQVVQLLCEGHNNDLQNYLRQQTNSKVSYDIISLMVKLVITNKISDPTYESLVQCLETLTEVVQGPCKENQILIVTSKFISWSVDLLKEDVKIFEQGKNEINRVRLIRIKMKCTNTLLSLMELQEENEEIMNLMIRSIPINVLVSELGKFYTEYKNIYKSEYVLSCYKTYLLEEDGYEQQKENEIVIEYGFNLFILINILMLNNKKSSENELDEIKKLIDEYQQAKKKSNQGLVGFLDININLNLQLPFGQNDEEESSELKRAQELKKAQQDGYKFFSENTVFIEILREEQLQRIYFPLLPQCKMLPKESKKEFLEYVDHSSIRDKLVYLMNQADYMRKVMEHEELLRNLFKKFKVVELIATHKSLWEQLAFVTNVIINLVILCSYGSYAYTDTLDPLFPISFNGIRFSQEWMAQNEMYFATTEPDPDSLWNARLNEPRLFFISEYTWTRTFIMILGYLNLGFSLLVITFFAIKKAPLLITDMWKEFLKTPMGWFQRIIMSFVTICKSFINCLVDFDFAYYFAYMSCIIVGLVIHPFAFVLLLADFLRISTLKIVIKAIWISKGQMGLSFLVFLLVEYYFAVIGYLFFWDQYQDGSCQIMWRCFLQTFDQTFKNGGAIGDYLADTQLQAPDGSQLPINYDLTQYQQNRFIYRFVFDVLFKFILVFLIINMVAGIIIDTFGALKDAMLEKQSNLEDFCFICGIQSEKLDKSTQHGHYSHIKKNHHMWNYVYYKVYLYFKNKSDLSGNETYVKRLMMNNEIDWFPVKKAIGFIDEDDDDEEQNEDNLQLIEETFQEVSELEQQALSTNQKLKNFLFDK